MAAINSVADLTLEGDIAVLTINSPPVNALSAAVRDGLRDGMRQAAADPAAKAIVLICAGRTFIAPYSLRPLFSRTRLISFFSSSSRISRADGFSSLFFAA